MIRTSVTCCALALASLQCASAADAPIARGDWTIAGPFGGTARSIALDPQKPSVVLAGGMNSLLFRSQDSGKNWELLNFPKRNLSEVTSILVDPANSSHYLAGMISAEGGGLFDSGDGGKTWRPVSEISHFGVRALSAAPGKPSRFVAGTLQGVWLSEDSGKTWRRISDPENLEMQGITVIAIDSQNSDIIYAGTSHLPWRTLDGGKTWQPINAGMIDDSDVFSMYVDPANPTDILASACSGIYASSSRGDQWRKLMGIPNTSRRTHVIRQDPANASTIFAGTTTGLYKSLNRGATWRTLNSMQANSVVFDLTQTGPMYLAFEYEGIGKSDNGGEQVKLVNQGFVDRTITAATRSGDRLYAIETQEGSTSGIFASANRGETWTQLQDVRGLEGVHLDAIAGLPSSNGVLLAASPHQMYKSFDRANSWRPIPIKLMETIQPPTPKPAVSHSRTVHGRPVRTAASRPAKPIVKIRDIFPSEISALYASHLGGQDLLFAATNLGLLKSSDAGERWTMAQIPGLPEVSAVYFSPDVNGDLIARTSGGLYRSKDCGDHWENFQFPLPVSDVNEIAIAGGKNDTLLAATRVGLYSSPDNGTTWYANRGGFPASTVSSVAFAGSDGSAYAVQYGRLFETLDSGNNWKEVPTEIPALRIRQLWMPDISSGRLYGITSDLGILFRDGGQIR